MNKYRIVIITVLFIFSLSLPTLSQSDEGGCQRIEVETQLLENAFMMNIVCNPADNENASNNVVDLSQIAYGTSDSIFILGEDEGFGSISTAVPLPICFVWHVQDTSDNTTLPLSCTNDSREFSQDIFAADRWWNNGVNFIAYQIYFEDLDSPINLCPPQEEDRCYTDIQLISEITIDEQLNTWQELATQDRANTLWNPIIIEFPLATSESNIPTAPMVLVPNGSIARGETGEYSLVEVEPFWIDRFEATIELYTQVTDDNTRIGTASYESDHPVTNISYNEAQNFCELRNMRLPTQSEWEFAARGVDALRYPWGEEFPQLQDADDYLIFGENASTSERDGSRKVVSPIGNRLLGASWVGALDMSGNLAEYVVHDSEIFPDAVVAYMGGHLRVEERDRLAGYSIIPGDIADVDARVTYVGVRCVREYSETDDAISVRG